MAQLIPILQTAIGPMILISGVGLLVLTMTNRLARVIDRARALSRQIPAAGQPEMELLDRELCVLWRRARLLRQAIALVAGSALAAAVLIILLFFTALLQLEVAWLMATLFVICMACLIAGLVTFIVDVNLSLDVLALELKAAGFQKC